MLSPGAIEAISRTAFADVRWHDSIDSTNRALLDLARAGAPEGVVVAADHQTAGRGRLDRRWEAPPGSSLLVSVLLRPPLPAERVHLVSVVTSCAAAAACEDVAGFRPGLKWPNDLVVDDRKLAGVLAETVAGPGGIAAIVVGMGLNVNWPDDAPAGGVSANRVVAHDVDREALLVRFIQCLDERYRVLCAEGGAAAAALEYNERCVTLGRMVRADLPGGQSVVGRAVRVTDDGHLVVDVDRDGRGRVVVRAGDIVHLRPVFE